MNPRDRRSQHLGNVGSVSILLLLVIAMSSCAPAAAPLPAPLSTDKPSVTQAVPTALSATNAVPKPSATLSAAPASTAAPTRVSATSTKLSASALTLKVTAPANESIVRTSSVTVSGQTVVGAVVSVNDDLADVDSKGVFKDIVNLAEGPNTIEVVASDIHGNEVSAILLVIYEP